MNKDIKAMENHIAELLVQNVIENKEAVFFRKKCVDLQEHFDRLDGEFIIKMNKVSEMNWILKAEISKQQMQNTLQIERQRVYGESQTKVETARHANIMEELKFMKEAEITNFNRSSYPVLPRHHKPNGQKKELTKAKLTSYGIKVKNIKAVTKITIAP